MYNVNYNKVPQYCILPILAYIDAYFEGSVNVTPLYTVTFTQDCVVSTNHCQGHRIPQCYALAGCHCNDA